MGHNKSEWLASGLNPLRAVEPDDSWEYPALTQHYMRYSMALQFIKNNEVLDASCGSCYGTSLLSMRATHVMGVNLDANQIDFGKEWFKFYCPVELKQMDLCKDFPDKKFDVVVSLETVEHLADYKPFLEKIKASLRNEKGIFVFSVPRTVITCYHLQAIPDIEHAKSMFEPYFKNIKWYYQTGECISDVCIGYPAYWIGVYKNG